MKPTIEHPHSEARSITGGPVYYGAMFPEYQGCYLYGDYSTGKVWAAVPEGGAEDIDRAVTAARRAFEGGPWPNLTPTERGALLRKLGDLVSANAAQLARLESTDNGKAIRDVQGAELPAIANWYYYYGGLADKIQGETIPLAPNVLNYTLREPVGVVGAIIPWNSPLWMMAFKLAPALLP